MAAAFKPIIRWAQSKESLFLTVELSDVQYPVVELTSTRLVFQGFGHGARGEQHYHVDINFYKPVDIKESSHKVLDRYVGFNIAKVAGEHEFWPRLLLDEKKPAWLKINFDRWQSEDASDSEKAEPEEKAEVEILADNDVRKLQVQLNENRSKEDVFTFVRTFYLVAYYLMQAVLFSYIASVLLSRVILRGTEAFAEAYDAVSDILASCQLAAILEVIHPIFGIARTGVLVPFVQVFGRNLVLFFVVVAHKELHKQAAVFWLFLVWSLIDVIRYPFYAALVAKKRIEPLIWLQYTMWIPLYPLAVFFEGK